MPASKSDINISIRVGDKLFSIGGVLLPDGKYLIKRGRSYALKIPQATLTEIFIEARKWAVAHI